MFLKDISIGFPGGYKYFDSDLKKQFNKNHYSSLLMSVTRDRIMKNLPTAGLEIAIQTYICSNCSDEIRQQYCADSSKPKEFRQKTRSCGTCGGKKK